MEIKPGNFFPNDQTHFVFPCEEFSKVGNIVRVVKNSRPYEVDFVIVNVATSKYCEIATIINPIELTKEQRNNAPILNYNKIWQLSEEEAVSGKYF